MIDLTSVYRVTVVSDCQIVEICRPLKNIVACAAGFCDGLKMGDDTKSCHDQDGIEGDEEVWGHILSWW